MREDPGLPTEATGALSTDPAALGSPPEDPISLPAVSPIVEALPSSSSTVSGLGELRSTYEIFEELLHSSGPSGSRKSVSGGQREKPLSSFLQLSQSIHGFLKYAVDSHARIRRAKKKIASEAKAKRAAEGRASAAEAEIVAEREKAELELASARALIVKSDNEARVAREEAATAKKGAYEKVSQLEADLAAVGAKLSFLEDQQQKQLTAAASDAVATYRNSQSFQDDLTTYSAGAFLAGKDDIRDHLHVKCPDFDFSLLDDSDDSGEE